MIGERKNSVQFMSKQRNRLEKKCIDVEREDVARKASEEKWHRNSNAPDAYYATETVVLPLKNDIHGAKWENKVILHEPDENLVDVLANVGVAPEQPIMADSIKGCRRVPTWLNSTNSSEGDAS